MVADREREKERETREEKKRDVRESEKRSVVVKREIKRDMDFLLEKDFG